MGVYSVRTSSRIDEILKKISKEQTIPISRVISNIVHKHIDMIPFLRSNTMLVPKEILASMFNLLTESQCLELSEMTFELDKTGLKLDKRDDTYLDFLDKEVVYYKTSSMEFSIFNNNNHFKLVCRHNLGKNWSSYDLTFHKLWIDHFGMNLLHEQLESNHWELETK